MMQQQFLTLDDIKEGNNIDMVEYAGKVSKLCYLQFPSCGDWCIRNDFANFTDLHSLQKFYFQHLNLLVYLLLCD